MGVLRKIGYEYNGWKLGERVKCKDDGKEYTIIGFDESSDGGFIAINRAYISCNIDESWYVTSYIKTNDTCFEWLEECKIEKIKGVDKMKKEVLVLEYQEVFDMVACRIVHQDEKILKRYKFSDKSLDVYSVSNPSFQSGKLYIRGEYRSHDDSVFLVRKVDAEVIKQKVKAINEKYGSRKRWRAEENGYYWFVDVDCKIKKTPDWFESIDNRLYQNGNYFKTYEQAEEACRRMKEVLKEYQEELLNEVCYER